MAGPKIPYRTNSYIISNNETFRKEIPIVVYILIGVLCFMPVLGALAGVVLIIFGAVVYKNKILIVLGSGGIFINVAFFSFSFYLANHINNIKYFNNAAFSASETQMKTLVKDIELYKTKKGTYPASLQVMDDGNYSNACYDPGESLTNKKTTFFYYEVVDEKYYLFSLGKDGKPFTDDDVLPPFHRTSDYDHIGLIPR
ncbi:MAG: hypothetical protein V4592_14015 [Bacteroidota bacterium]